MKPVKKVLIIRFSSIGDIVLTTPVIRCIKQQLNAEVHVLTKNRFQNILEANPYVNKIWGIEKRVKEILPELKKEGFDLIVDLHNNIRSSQVKFGLGKPTVTFDKINFSKWLIVNLKINRLPNVHIVDRYLAPLAKYGVKNDQAGLDYFIPEEAKESAQHKLPKTPFIAFVIGAAHHTKRLTTEQIISICKKITAPIVILGGPAEAQEGKYIAVEAGDHVWNGCGELKLHESAYFVKEAHRVITHDTGMMHIAAAFDKPIISVWGNTIPEFGMSPYDPQRHGNASIIEVKGLACRPCSKIGYPKCPKGHFKCIRDISETDILKSLHT